MADKHEWEYLGTRSATISFRPAAFIQDLIRPLFLSKRESLRHSSENFKILQSEKEFWSEGVSDGHLGSVTLNNFRVIDWFPRSPGVYHSRAATEARRVFGDSDRQQMEPRLGKFYLPTSRANIIEWGGIGSIRLRPRTIDGQYCWLGTAASGQYASGGVPVAIPETLLSKNRFRWGDSATLTGRVRFLQDVGLQFVAQDVIGTRSTILLVDELLPKSSTRIDGRIIISPVLMFDGRLNGDLARLSDSPIQYTFANCNSGSDSELDRALDWMQQYAALFEGHIITNCDEQRPILADAPLSYQRLVANTHDRGLLRRLGGADLEHVFERLSLQIGTLQYQEVHMGNNISVGGNAIINVDSVLSNVTQELGSSGSLNARQKQDLEQLIAGITISLQPVETSEPEVARAVAEAVQKAVADASKPKTERTKPFMDYRISSLLQVAKLAVDIAPSLVHEVGKLAEYIQSII